MVLAVVFVLGTAFGQSQRGIRWTRAVRALAAKYMNTSRATAVPPRPKPAPEVQRQKPDVEPDPMPLLEDKSPDQRTLNEAVALGHYWLRQSTEQFEALSRELKLRPELLADEATRERLVGLIKDRTTSVQALELLARMATPAALDVLYEVWIGSKDRTDTTRLAEALLLAADVRPHAGPALELALALRDRPTDCDQIRKLVETALQLGDRRSAMLLVRAAARTDCTKGSSTIQCMLCLDDARKMRAAIKTAAGRQGPIFHGSPESNAGVAAAGGAR
jgi:hypothetical protein